MDSTIRSHMPWGPSSVQALMLIHVISTFISITGSKEKS